MNENTRDIRIKTYQSQFIENQARVGEEITQSWSMYWQSGAEQLKLIYSDKCFDPSTRYYAFADDEMVGFLVAKIEMNETDLHAPILPSIVQANPSTHHGFECSAKKSGNN